MSAIPIGYLFIATGLISFAGMGIIHKVGEKLRGDPLTIAFFAVLTGGILSAAYSLATGVLSTHAMPPMILLIGLPFGASAGLALWLFQTGLKYGRIATSWLLINLSAAVPTILSIAVYREHLETRQVIALALVVASLLLLWWDRQRKSVAESEP